MSSPRPRWTEPRLPDLLDGDRLRQRHVPHEGHVGPGRACLHYFLDPLSQARVRDPRLAELHDAALDPHDPRLENRVVAGNERRGRGPAAAAVASMKPPSTSSRGKRRESGQIREILGHFGTPDRAAPGTGEFRPPPPDTWGISRRVPPAAAAHQGTPDTPRRIYPYIYTHTHSMAIYLPGT